MTTPICGPVCQHPGCWKARSAAGIAKSLPAEIPPYFKKHHYEDDLPTLKVSSLEPEVIERHRALPPIRRHTFQPTPTPPSRFHCFQPRDYDAPRVSHIIVQAGFQCYPQKRWIWLPSVYSQIQQHSPNRTQATHQIRDMTNELIQSRPSSSKYPVYRVHQSSRVNNSRAKRTTYLDFVKKFGFLNVLDIPDHLQAKLLEDATFRKMLSMHAIEHIPYSVLPDSVLVELEKCRISCKLPNNPAFDGVGIFFDPPDDFTSKNEPKKLIIPRRRSSGPEPVTYVPSNKKLQPTTLPVPKAVQVPVPSFREYVMMKRAESAQKTVIEVPKPGSYHDLTSATPAPSERSLSTSEHIDEDEEEGASNPAITKTDEFAYVEIENSMNAILEGEEEEEENLPFATVEGIHIPSAMDDDNEEMELVELGGSIPPTRDSWRYTSFSTVTPYSEYPPDSSYSKAKKVLVDNNKEDDGTSDVVAAPGPHDAPAPVSTPTDL